MKNITNVFQEGIITDQNPLTMPETVLTSALNATIITGNGNEGLLQNDMGNTLIKDSITGNIMSLNDGFIPIGMKEHGGILYIASYNPATNEGELGSIPSPILNYTYSTQNGSSNNISISDISSNSNASVAERINSSLIYLSDHVFHGGDKFIINLQLGLDQTTYTRQVYDNNGNQVSESFPIVTKFDGNDIKKGWYSIKLYAVTDSGKEILLSDAMNTPQRYYKSNDSTERTSDYWFLTDISDLDINKTRSRSDDNLFRTYPNIPAGRLGIKVVPEYHKELQFIYNTSYNDNLPQIYLKTEGNNQQNWVIVHGFTYESDCPIQPDKIEIDCQGLDLYECTDDGPSTKIGTTVVLEKDGNDYSYKVTTNLENKYIIEKDWVNSMDRSVENYNGDINGLFAVNINNLNTDIIFNTKLYIKDSDNNFILYKDDSWKGLPIFNPALYFLEQSGSSTFSYQYVPQYYEFDHTNNDTFEVELFNNSTQQKCFIYDSNVENNPILIYNSSENKYNPTGNTVNSYKNIRTWIYPICYLDAYNGGPHFIWKSLDGGDPFSGTESYFWETDPEGRQCWGKPDGTTVKFISDKAFVKCPKQPRESVMLNGQSTPRPLLVPIARSARRIGAEKQKQYFEQLNNEFNLKVSDLQNYSLYQVNLNAVNYGFNIINDSTFSDGTTNWFISGGAAWCNFGQYGVDIPKAWELGIETFWTTRSRDIYGGTIYQDRFNGLEDYPLEYNNSYKSGNFTRTGSVTIQGLNSGECASFNGNNNIQDIDYSIHQLRSNQTGGLLLPQDFVVPFGTQIIPGSKNNKICPKHLYLGFVNKILSLCPGYCNIGQPFELNLKFIDHSFSSEYLYKDPLNFKLVNETDTKGIFYLLFYNRFNSSGGIEVRSNYNSNNDCDARQLKIEVTQTIGEKQIKNEFKPIRYYERFEESDTNKQSILDTNEVAISIDPKEKSFSFNLEVNPIDTGVNYSYLSGSAAIPYDLEKYNLARSIIVTPQLFIDKAGNGLSRKYCSDYILAKQINLGGSNFDGISQNITVPANIDITTNYLTPNEDYSISDGEDETMDRYGLGDMTSINYTYRNSFQNQSGYYPLSHGTTHHFDFSTSELERGAYVFNINYYYKDMQFSNLNNCFQLSINNSETHEFGLKRNWVILNVDSLTPTSISLGLTCSIDQNMKNCYIKNIGLYKINDEDISNSIQDIVNALGFLQNENNLYNSVILPGVYCFRETKENGDKVGCINTEFVGFQELPMYSYQECLGFYGLGKHVNNGENSHDLAYIIESKSDILDDQIEKIKIRIISEENDS